MAISYPLTISTYLQLRTRPIAVSNIFAARAADILWPNRVIMTQGGESYFSVEGNIPGVGSRLDAWVSVQRYFALYGLRVAIPFLQEDMIDPRYAPGWISQAFTYNNIKSSTVPYYDNAYLAAKGLWEGRVLPAFGQFMPEEIKSQVAALQSIGLLIAPTSKNADWLAVSELKDAWGKVAEASNAIYSSYLKDHLSALAAEGEALRRNADFWSGVERTLQALATMGASEVLRKVDDLKEKLRDFKKAKQAALDNAATKSYTEQQNIYAEINKQEAILNAKLAPVLSFLPALKNELDQEGLGVITVVAGVSWAVAGLVVIVAITAAVSSINIIRSFGKGASFVAPIAGAAAFGIGLWALWAFLGKKVR